MEEQQLSSEKHTWGHPLHCELVCPGGDIHHRSRNMNRAILTNEKKATLTSCDPP